MDYITDSDLYARYNYSRNGGHEYQQNETEHSFPYRPYGI